MNTTFATASAAQPWNRFLACADAYGAQRSAWPDSEWALYDQFAGTIAGQEALHDARALDALLVDDTTMTLSPEFMARLQTMPLPPQNRVQSYVVVMWKRSALLLILMAVLGFGNGYVDTQDLSRVLDSGTMTTAFGVASAD
jgi:hypothetical protein